MSYDSSDAEQAQEPFHYDDRVAVQQWTLNSAQQAQYPQPAAGNTSLPPSRPTSITSLSSMPDRSRRQQDHRADHEPQFPRGHWEYVGGETHAGEYAQNFNSSRSSDSSSASACEGIQMAVRPRRGRGCGRGGSTVRASSSGGRQDAYTQRAPPPSERQVRYQDTSMEQQQPPPPPPPPPQQQLVLYAQPGLDPPMTPESAVLRDRDQTFAPQDSSSRPRPSRGHGRRRSRQSKNSCRRSRSNHGSEPTGDCCC